jgi:asparagine synthase (glutamine-hydrolysing)
MGYDAYFDYMKLEGINSELSSTSKDFMLSYHAQNPNLSRNYENLRRIYEGDLPIFRLIGESFNPLQKSKLLKDKPQIIDTDIKAMYESIKYNGSAYWMSYMDIKHWIGEVLMSKMDRMSMAHSLESRAPFLDYRLVEFVMSLPSDMRLGDATKTLLKKIAEKYIPNEIVHRQKKGFSSPYFEWYYEVYGEKILEEFMLVNRHLGWFDDEFLRFLFEQGKIGKFKQHTWGLIVFCRWFIHRFI